MKTSLSERYVTTQYSLLEPTEHHFENQAVLNPGCISEDGIVHMFYRAVQQGNHSTIGYCQLKDGEVIYRSDKPILTPEFEYECHGIEDPRIVHVDGMYYMTYIAFDGKNAQIAYATAETLPNFTKQGVISPPFRYTEVVDMCRDHPDDSIHSFYHRYYQGQEGTEDLLVYEKDALFFPTKINGRFALIHRIFPEIQVAYFDDFSQLTKEYWQNHFENLEHHTVLKPRFWFENRHIGAGCPPIETDAGWLFIYHAVEENTPGERVYHAAAALLDKNDPTHLVGQLDQPLFSPEEEWELSGDVNNVVFPSGAVVEGNDLHIYYGAADSRIAVKTLNLTKLLADLQGLDNEEEQNAIYPGLQLAY